MPSIMVLGSQVKDFLTPIMGNLCNLLQAGTSILVLLVMSQMISGISHNHNLALLVMECLLGIVLLFPFDYEVIVFSLLLLLISILIIFCTLLLSLISYSQSTNLPKIITVPLFFYSDGYTIQDKQTHQTLHKGPYVQDLYHVKTFSKSDFSPSGSHAFVSSNVSSDVSLH